MAFAAVAFLPLPSAHAQDDDNDRVTVSALSSTHMRTGSRISRVSVASSDIADVAAFPPDQVLITGKQVGTTTAMIWDANDNVRVIVVDVTFPVDAMRSALRKAIPGAKNLDVEPAGRAVVLTGMVPSVEDIHRAEQVVAGVASAVGDVSVVNSLTVPGDQQVQVEVAFAEVSRTGLREIGMNFWTRDAAAGYAGGLIAPTNGLGEVSPELATTPDVAALGLSGADPLGVPIVQAPLASTFGAIFTSTLGGFPFSAALSLLSNRGYSRTLAEPTLVAMSGQSATFLAGGEFPLPLPQSLGTIGVDYKKFGVQLHFTPTIVGDTIQLAMDVTVSDIDFNLGLRLAQVTVPGLTERHASTTVRMKDGQSFVIAGLLSDRVRSSVDKVPWLGDVPILGALFRSTSYRREETELLVVVTVRRVRPLNERPELPGETTTTDPSDLELFLLGRHESLENGDDGPRARNNRRAEMRRPVGAVGFKR